MICIKLEDQWVSVTHLSFCFEKTLYQAFHRCLLPNFGSCDLVTRFQRRFFTNNQKKRIAYGGHVVVCVFLIPYMISLPRK